MNANQAHWSIERMCQLLQVSRSGYRSFDSFKPNMQELPDVVYEFVVDRDVARHEFGDLINPLATDRLSEERPIHLPELATGRRPLKVYATTIFRMPRRSSGRSAWRSMTYMYVAQIFHATAEAEDRVSTPEL